MQLINYRYQALVYEKRLHRKCCHSEYDDNFLQSSDRRSHHNIQTQTTSQHWIGEFSLNSSRYNNNRNKFPFLGSHLDSNAYLHSQQLCVRNR